MSKKLFTNEEIELLSKNKYIKNITIKGITYTEELYIAIAKTIKNIS